MERRELYMNKVLEVYRTLAKFVVYGARGEPPLWPFSIIETNWYYTKFFPKEIYYTIKALEEKGISDKKIAELCWGPSAITHWFYIIEPTIGDSTLNPFEGLSKEEGIDFIEKIVDILSHQRKGDVFCQDMKNILLSDNEVNQLVKDKEFIETKDNSEIEKALRGLTMSLWHYTILVQAGHRAYSQEFHGHYLVEKKKLLLIKDFFNLKPGKDADSPIWNFSLKLPYDKIRVLEVYENAEIQIDMFNHYNVSGDLVRFRVIAEDLNLTEEEIKTLSNICANVVSEGSRTIRDFSKSDWVKKIIELRYLWLKPHKDILGEDWSPPMNVYYLANKTDEASRVAEQFEKNLISLIKGLSPDEIVEKVAQVFVDIIYHEGA